MTYPISDRRIEHRQHLVKLVYQVIKFLNKVWLGELRVLAWAVGGSAEAVFSQILLFNLLLLSLIINQFIIY
jgi:hypothetical protein